MHFIERYGGKYLLWIFETASVFFSSFEKEKFWSKKKCWFFERLQDYSLPNLKFKCATVHNLSCRLVFYACYNLSAMFKYSLLNCENDKSFTQCLPLSIITSEHFNWSSIQFKSVDYYNPTATDIQNYVFNLFGINKTKNKWIY